MTRCSEAKLPLPSTTTPKFLPAVALALILALALSTTACVLPPAVLAVVTATTVDVAQDRRTPGKFIDDNVLEVRLRKDIKKDSNLRDANVSVTVLNSVVLLTGQVNTDVQRQQASELANRYITTHKAKVVNELTLAGKTNLTSRFNDSWITTKVKARLFRTRNAPASSVKIITEHGKVYLLGLVTQGEAEATVDAVRTVRGVTHIVKVFEYVE